MLTKRRRQPKQQRKKVYLAKQKTLHVQHTFFYISMPLFCMTTTWNFQKLPGYTFYGGNVVCGPVYFSFAPAPFYLGGR